MGGIPYILAHASSFVTLTICKIGSSTFFGRCYIAMYSVSLTFIADALTLMYARHLSPFHASLHLFPFQFLSAAALFIPYWFTSIMDRFSKDLSGVDLINKLLMRPTFCHPFHSYGGVFSIHSGWLAKYLH